MNIRWSWFGQNEQVICLGSNMLEVEDKGSYICSKMLTNKSFYGEIHIKIIKL